ncbi:MAG: TrkA C-terminal domain-containing protein [Bacteroidota bacterium]
MIESLSANPLLLLFLVAALGYGLGSISFRGNKLGVAGVLFVGLIFGGLDKSLVIPEIIFLMGLSIFVYAIGISSGPGFFAAFQRGAYREVGFIIFMLTLSAAWTVLFHFIFGLDAATTGGIFAGTTTNTPALAGLLDSISERFTGEARDQMIKEAVVGYSLSYPMGVIGVMFGMFIMQKWLKVDYRKEELALRKDYPVAQKIVNGTIDITREDLRSYVLRDILQEMDWSAVFGRVFRGHEVIFSNYDTKLEIGDKVNLAAREADWKEVVEKLGKVSDKSLSNEDDTYIQRRMFVSNPKLAGRSIASLNLSGQFPIIVTRVRRGDVDMIAHGDTILELGDRVRFVALRKDLEELKKLFGDSYFGLSQLNLLSFGLGMAAGLLLGMIKFQLPGGIEFSLGFAGGPLIVALVLGAQRRTGMIVWSLPYSANHTLRQLGLILLLAAIGVRSGHTFFDTVAAGGGGMIFLTGTLIAVLSTISMLFVGYKLFKIPYTFLGGMSANQPAILDYAIQNSGNQLPNIGYALMFPIAIILKIVYVQILFVLL